jgi:hypothetical protein
MPQMRCPRHDFLFETETDHSKPGMKPSHPKDERGISGHPDCPLCQKEKKSVGATGNPSTRRIA